MSKLRDHADVLRFDRNYRHLAETFRSEGFRRYIQGVIGEVKRQLKIREEAVFFSCIGDTVQVIFPVSGFQYHKLLRAVERFSLIVNMPRHVPSLIPTPGGREGIPVSISASAYLRAHTTTTLETKKIA